MTKASKPLNRFLSLAQKRRVTLLCWFLCGVVISALFIFSRLSYQSNNFPVTAQIAFADSSPQAEQQSSAHDRRKAIKRIQDALSDAVVLQRASSVAGLSNETLAHDIKTWTSHDGETLVIILSNINGGDTKLVLSEMLDDIGQYVDSCKEDGLIPNSLSLKTVVAPRAWKYELIESRENVPISFMYILLSGTLFAIIALLFITVFDVYRKGCPQ